MLPAFLGGDSLDAEASAQALIFLPTFPRAHCQHLFHLCGMKVTSTCSPVTLGLDWHQRLDMWQKPSDYGLWYWDSDYHCLPTFGRLRNSNSFLSPLLRFQVYVCPHAQMYVVAWMCWNPRMILRVSLSHSPLTLWKYDPKLNPKLEDMGRLASQFCLEIPCLCFLCLWVPQLQVGGRL